MRGSRDGENIGACLNENEELKKVSLFGRKTVKKIIDLDWLPSMQTQFCTFHFPKIGILESKGLWLKGMANVL